jgi:hypothetical protein
MRVDSATILATSSLRLQTVHAFIIYAYVPRGSESGIIAFASITQSSSPRSASSEASADFTI